MATKKIKKVETPIDQRETFVSLQKNFADSEISVEEKLKTLYALQEADSAIDKIMQMRGELPSEVEALENEIADLRPVRLRMSLSSRLTTRRSPRTGRTSSIATPRSTSTSSS